MPRILPLLAVAEAALLLHCWGSESGRERYADGTVNELVPSQSPEERWQFPDAELERQPEPPPPIRFADSDPLPELEPKASSELALFFPADAELVGVAVDPADSASQPYLLEARTGLYQLSAAGAQRVFDLRSSRVQGGTGDGSAPAELTDVAFDALRAQQSGQPSFALTAENDGFALSLPGTALDSYFCYLPRTFFAVPSGATTSLSQELREQGVAVVERTEAVAVNPVSSQIMAQPRTLRLDAGGVAGSELFVFGAAGGQPLGTWRLERSEFAAGGAAFFGRRYLVLGFGADLYFTSGWGDTVVRTLHLRGVERITGIATEADGDLLVLDGPNRRLLEVGVDQIAHALGN